MVASYIKKRKDENIKELKNWKLSKWTTRIGKLAYDGLLAGPEGKLIFDQNDLASCGINAETDYAFKVGFLTMETPSLNIYNQDILTD